VETQQCIPCVVELHVTTNYIKILSATQQCSYCKFISTDNNKTLAVLHVQCSILHWKKQSYFAHGLQTCSVAGQIVMTDKSLCCFWVLVTVKNFTSPDVINQLRSNTLHIMKERVCVYCCHRYLECKSHIFCAAFVVKRVLSFSTILYYTRHDFLKIYWTYYVYFDFLCNFVLKHFSFYFEFR
jgi:hypothetical protein